MLQALPTVALQVATLQAAALPILLQRAALQTIPQTAAQPMTLISTP